jgi:IS5 family transposase
VLENCCNRKHNKIYSIHEPQVACIAKGKQHKPYEFGNKIAIATTAHNNIIVGVESFTGNPHDSKTLEPVLKTHIIPHKNNSIMQA